MLIITVLESAIWNFPAQTNGFGGGVRNPMTTNGKPLQTTG